jgi:hypothetical protein
MAVRLAAKSSEAELIAVFSSAMSPSAVPYALLVVVLPRRRNKYGAMPGVRKDRVSRSDGNSVLMRTEVSFHSPHHVVDEAVAHT